jgi:tRNA(Glu) U13 pseudouridine synthase TruD
MTVERIVNRDSEKDDATHEDREQGAALSVCFVLPKGAYATSVLGAAVAFEPEMSPMARATAEEGDRSMERAETELE